MRRNCGSPNQDGVHYTLRANLDPIMLTATDFFDLSEFEHAELFPDGEWVWRALERLEEYLCQVVVGELPRIRGSVSPAATLVGSRIVIGEGTVVEAGACIVGPAYIGRNCEIRHGAYIREQVLMGDRCVVGHATEVKNSILLNDAKAPHFAYVGDSILGNDVNLGAGTKLSNLAISSAKSADTGRRPTIRMEIDGERVDTGLTKLGAIIGDRSQLGCNSVANPGCLIGADTLVYANASLPKGFIASKQVVKLRQELAITRRRQI